ncbi:hypothetical protein DFA_03542 [Cavenderia fasciculata]|uniref:Rho GTPase n=1 Tax=Cavenderia fasciculata TaxID=261658 RepID=F4PHV9_CACFS|nr:uncharacterized protein DFA_03542 [Cavenderia fasciculata]EGG25293.1 hypothetical protein DFA_03542 [Cavenderia fasciculata]|eukprot:XP_004363144.1 hypothetical protein DFA_03542 [Cavenderia fasciculata]
MRSIKCVLVGDSGVGKTCILISYTTNTFPDEYIPTVIDVTSVVIMQDNNAYTLELWDSAGHQDYDGLRPLSYPNTDVFFVCFSITSPSSFDYVSEKWIPEIQTTYKIPILLVGNKLDLRDDKQTIDRLANRNLAPITFEQGMVKAQSINNCQYFECSAKTQKGLHTIFDQAVTIVDKPIYPLQSKRKKFSTSCILF